MKKNRLLILFIFLACRGVVAQVGINTENPLATVHVSGVQDGNMIIRETPSKQEGDKRLVWNKITGQVKEAPDDPLYYLLSFSVECSSGEDFVKDFDTKIPSDVYTLIVTSIYPRMNQNPDWLDIRHAGENNQYRDWNNELGLQNKQDYQYVNPIRLSKILEKGGTWRLTIDFPDARPDHSFFSRHEGTVTWEISILAIKKENVRLVDNQNGMVRNDPNDNNNPVYSFTNPL